MAKLTKAETRAHQSAQALLDTSDRLTMDQAISVVQNWHEGATHTNTAMSAHFTPWELAYHAAFEIGDCKRVLDLCAGIGVLSLGCEWHAGHYPLEELVLVEINYDYAQVARRLLPRAEVIVGSVYDRGLMAELAARSFDFVISNPPFGKFARPAGACGPRYTGDAHFEVIDIASDLADFGVFVLPQGATPFKYSGQKCYSTVVNAGYEKFRAATHIELTVGLTDTALLPGFRGVPITTEIAIADFQEARDLRGDVPRPTLQAQHDHDDVAGQMDLFATEVHS